MVFPLLNAFTFRHSSACFIHESTAEIMKSGAPEGKPGNQDELQYYPLNLLACVQIDKQEICLSMGTQTINLSAIHLSAICERIAMAYGDCRSLKQ